ncbi:helix-turn-helix domain-containing protein [Limnohabitans sp.]|jgi:DNA-binding Xre family transcriptional regulator|uniref:helix-turn-helix domain-containing protein n=1 Tax=Limnohabitans sp. TaxID=1907725 RepID=UPI0037BEF65D
MSKLFVVNALKAHLKARDMTYRDLAQSLNASEVTIKRIFATSDCSLHRLEQICTLLQIEFADLFHTSPKQRKLITRLSPAQEKEFASNKHLLMMAICALNHWPVKTMWEHLSITPTEGLALLEHLDSMGFIELIDPERYKLLVSSNFAWINNGPIMRMVQGMSEEFFNDPFDGDGEILRIINVRLSKESQERLRFRLEMIAQEYVDQSRADSHLPILERSPVSVCIAARTWIPQFMQDLTRMAQDASAPPLARSTSFGGDNAAPQPSTD